MRCFTPKFAPLSAVLIATLLLLTIAPQPTAAAQAYLRSDRLGFTFIAYLNNLNDDADTRYRQALELGAGWTRWPLYWNVVEQSPGNYNWTQYDALVDADRRAGLKTNAILLGTPGFHMSGVSINGLSAPIYADGTDTPGPGKALNPANPWAVYVAAAVERYRPGGTLARERGWPATAGITVWEAWNEPDLDLFWRASKPEYARLLKITYIVTKNIDPRAQVMFGGLAYGNPDTDDWLDAVLNIYSQDPDRGRYNWYMDLVGLHSYSTARRTGQVVARVNNTITSYGLVKPIWVNETGVPVWDDYPGQTWSVDNPSERRWRSTMDQQAAFVMQSAAYAFAAGAEKVFFHQLYDDCGDSGGDFPPNSGRAGDAYGFFRNPRGYECFSQHPQPGTERPSATAYRTLAQVIGDANFTGRSVQRRLDGSVFVRLGLAGGQRLTFIWNETPTDNTISWPAETQSATLFGYDAERFMIAASNGNYTVTLPPARPNDDPQRPISEPFMIGGRTFVMVESDITPGADTPLAAAPIVGFATPRAPLPAQIGSVLGGDATPAAGSLAPIVDLTPPLTGMEDLPPSSPATFTVRWNGSDAGGIDRYLVWVRAGEGEWRPWFEGAATSAEFTGQPGETYAFAIWAVDRVGNWSANIDLQPQASTRVE